MCYNTKPYCDSSRHISSKAGTTVPIFTNRLPLGGETEDQRGSGTNFTPRGGPNTLLVLWLI